VFVRKPVAAGRRKGKARAPERLDPAQAPQILSVPRALLSAGAVRLLEDLARSSGMDAAGAAAALLNQAALERSLGAPSPSSVDPLACSEF